MARFPTVYVPSPPSPADAFVLSCRAVVEDSRAQCCAGVHARLAHVSEAPVGVPGDFEAAGGVHHENTRARRGLLQGEGNASSFRLVTLSSPTCKCCCCRGEPDIGHSSASTYGQINRVWPEKTPIVVILLCFSFSITWGGTLRWGGCDGVASITLRRGKAFVNVRFWLYVSPGVVSRAGLISIGDAASINNDPVAPPRPPHSKPV